MVIVRFVFYAIVIDVVAKEYCLLFTFVTCTMNRPTNAFVCSRAIVTASPNHFLAPTRTLESSLVKRKMAATLSMWGRMKRGADRNPLIATTWVSSLPSSRFFAMRSLQLFPGHRLVWNVNVCMDASIETALGLFQQRVQEDASLQGHWPRTIGTTCGSGPSGAEGLS